MASALKDNIYGCACGPDLVLVGKSRHSSPRLFTAQNNDQTQKLYDVTSGGVMVSMNVYISHSGDQDISSLRDLLRREGAQIHDSYDILASSDITNTLRSAIQNADAFVAIVGEHKPNVFFEIGLAVALDKPLLILLQPGASSPPFALQSMHLVSDLKETEILRIALKKFLTSPTRSAGRSAVPEDRELAPPTQAALEKLANKIGKLRKSGNPKQVENIVGELLAAAEINTVEEYTDDRDAGVDFAVWSDPLRSSLGNPVLIEVKARKLNEFSFRTAYSNLATYVARSDAQAGVLLYLDPTGHRFGKPSTWLPSVLWFDLEDFAKELVRKPFATVLLERRNKAVHGLA